MKHRFELILMDLYDVGRSIDLSEIGRLLPSSHELRIDKTRDTPESLYLPHPFVAELLRLELPSRHPLESLELHAKLYEDGVVSIICRVVLSSALENLHRIRGTSYEFEEIGEVTLRGLMQQRFGELYETIRQVVRTEEYVLDPFEHETYSVFCLIDRVARPQEFLRKNANYLSTFLLGERPDIVLHESQIASTFRSPFSFRRSDLLVLDLDRCFIIDPERDYEDILLVIELANYQLLELRALDKLLDRWLDHAEDDIRNVYMKRSHRTRRLSRKLGTLLPLRLDALFILENLENTSKIIGDYYLGQIYAHLCEIINTKEWELSVRRRLETLQSIYSMAKLDVNERLLLTMEVLVVVFFAVEIVALVLPLLIR
jgi:hypothetical protein